MVVEDPMLNTKERVMETVKETGGCIFIWAVIL